ncbi:MAG: hypothetical protein DRG78_00090 [Epsilonproteobacteria bacterium]|nr:MAG: hypothetical protein DRG78_00090 [Campylobacterota bacterium]
MNKEIKRAVIVIGEEASGKTKTINLLKEQILEINTNQQIYTTIDNDELYIYSQTMQEKGDHDTSRLENRLNVYYTYKYVILPSRPLHDNDTDLCLMDIIKTLEKYEYNISYVTINGDGQRNYGYYVNKAEDIFDLINIETVN